VEIQEHLNQDGQILGQGLKHESLEYRVLIIIKYFTSRAMENHETFQSGYTPERELTAMMELCYENHKNFCSANQLSDYKRDE
jgi:hypothetical protein